MPEPTAAPSGNETATNIAAATNEADENVAEEAPATNSNPPAAKPPPEAEEPARTPDASKKVAPSSEETTQTEAAAETGSLPLPSAVIVRTIEKIGYPCGSIASSSRIEGSSGSSDYLIRCASGASYRASNRTGRYRFSKAD